MYVQLAMTMDLAIAWLVSHIADATVQYGIDHPDRARLISALPVIAGAALYGWLYLTLWMGIQRQWMYVQGRSPLHEHLEQLSSEVDSIQQLTGQKNPPTIDADGFWYVRTYDPASGEPNGKKRVEPPASSHPIDLVNGSQRVRLHRS